MYPSLLCFITIGLFGCNKVDSFDVSKVPACREGFTKTAHKRKAPPDAFLKDLHNYVKGAPLVTLIDNQRPADRDIFKHLKAELGLNEMSSIKQRRAMLFELLRVSAAMESSFNWQEGRDMSANNTSPETIESGIFQTSCNSHVYVENEKYLRWTFLDELMQKNGVAPRDCVRWIPTMKDESKKEMIFEHHAFMIRHNFRHYGPLVDRERVGKNLSKQCMAEIQGQL